MRECAEQLQRALQAVPEAAESGIADATAASWRQAAREIDGREVAEMMGPPTTPTAPATEGDTAPHVASDVHAWTARGWHTSADAYSLRLSENTDRRLAEWCVVAVSAASAVRRECAEAEAVRRGLARADGAALAAAGALGVAGAAIGAVHVDAEGIPQLPEARTDEEGGVATVRLRYAQLQRAQQSGVDATLAKWGGEEGGWLRAAHASAPAEAEWTIHTRRQFRAGNGAAHRKEAAVMAVRRDGGVYAVAPPAAWPWRLEYEVSVRTAAEARIAATWIKAVVRLGRGADGEMAATVSAVQTESSGRAIPGAKQERSAVRLQLGARDGGLEALFWPFVWRGARQPHGTMRRALMRAITATEQLSVSNEEWTQLRHVLGGVVPQLTTLERAAERTRRDAARADAERAAEKEEAAATAAQEEAAAARQRQEAAAAEEATTATAAAESADEIAARRIQDMAATLAVEPTAEASALRKAFLLAALRAHPDKGGDAARFRAVHDAYNEMKKVTAAERAQLTEAAATARTAREDAAAAAAMAPMHPSSEARQAQAAARAARVAAAGAAAAANLQPAWREIAQHVVAARDAYMTAWQRHQQYVRQLRRAAAATGETPAEVAAYRAARAAEQRAARAAQKAAETARAVAEMRERERRTLERATAARQAHAERVRAVGGRAFLEAVMMDRTALETEYVVRLPLALLCKGTQWENAYRDSDEYEEYHMCDFEGDPSQCSVGGDGAENTRMHVRLERVAARGRVANDGSWDTFSMPWEHVAGLTCHGMHMCCAEIRRTEEDDATDDEELELERAEIRRAQRASADARKRTDGAARARMAQLATATAEAREAARAAATAGGDEVEREAGEAAAEAAAEHDEAETNDGEERDEIDELMEILLAEPGGEDEPEAAQDADGADDDEAATAADTTHKERHGGGRARAAWNGARWWQGAWMGPVAEAEFTTSRGATPIAPPRPARVTPMEAAATARACQMEADTLENRAAATATSEAIRRGRQMWQAAAATATAAVEAAAVAAVARAVQWWKTQSGAHTDVFVSVTTAEAATAAARQLQREQPAANAAAAAARTDAIRGLARVMAASGGLTAADSTSAMASVQTAMHAAPTAVTRGVAEAAASIGRTMVAHIWQAHTAAVATAAAAEVPPQQQHERYRTTAAAADATSDDDGWADEVARINEGSERAIRRPPRLSRWSAQPTTEGDDEGATTTARDDGATTTVRAWQWQDVAVAAAVAAARGVQLQRPGSIDIGKVTGPTGARVPTTPAPTGCIDVLANRDGPLGCFYVIPMGLNGRQDEHMRPAVVRAEAMLMAALKAGGGSTTVGTAQRIADKGPEGGGWRIRDRPQRAQLVVAKSNVKRDPTGAAKWREVCRLAERAARGEHSRLLCHCRWTRAAEAADCKECHCEVIANTADEMAMGLAAQRYVGAVGAAMQAAAAHVRTHLLIETALSAATGGEHDRVDVAAAIRDAWQQTTAARTSATPSASTAGQVRSGARAADAGVASGGGGEDAGNERRGQKRPRAEERATSEQAARHDAGERDGNAADDDGDTRTTSEGAKRKQAGRQKSQSKRRAAAVEARRSEMRD